MVSFIKSLFNKKLFNCVRRKFNLYWYKFILSLQYNGIHVKNVPMTVCRW